MCLGLDVREEKRKEIKIENLLLQEEENGGGKEGGGGAQAKGLRVNTCTSFSPLLEGVDSYFFS